MSKTAIITGAQQGIGAAVALSLIRQNVNVVMNYLDDDRLVQKYALQAESVGVKAALVRGNVGEQSTVSKLIECANNFGGVDYVVSNAAIFPRAPLLDMSLEDWDAVLNLNLRACFLLVRETAATMVQNKISGSIVTLSSGAALKGAVNGAHYSASKSGLLGFSKSAALELAKYGIRVNVVAPGLVDTDQPRGQFSEEDMDRLWQQHPLKGKTTVNDIADMVCFLLSEKSKRVTGQIVHVNGGGLMP
tara:strand:- start:66 stop:806 length:741 start_codon:yes stop_codon:yes gene_type:complete